MVLIYLVYTNVNYAVVIFKVLVHVVEGAHMPILGMNGSVQFAQNIRKFKCDRKW